MKNNNTWKVSQRTAPKRRKIRKNLCQFLQKRCSETSLYFIYPFIYLFVIVLFFIHLSIIFAIIYLPLLFFFILGVGREEKLCSLFLQWTFFFFNPSRPQKLKRRCELVSLAKNLGLSHSVKTLNLSLCNPTSALSPCPCELYEPYLEPGLSVCPLYSSPSPSCSQLSSISASFRSPFMIFHIGIQVTQLDTGAWEQRRWGDVAAKGSVRTGKDWRGLQREKESKEKNIGKHIEKTAKLVLSCSLRVSLICPY